MWPRPTNPIVAPGASGSTVCSVRGALLIDHLLRDPERLERRRHPAVHRRLQQHLLDLLRRAPVVECAAHVGAELGWLAERREHREVDEAAGPAVEPVAPPDGAPAELGDEVLHGLAELCAAGERAIDVLAPEDLAPDLEPAFVEAVVLGDAHVRAPLSYSASVTSSS